MEKYFEVLENDIKNLSDVNLTRLLRLLLHLEAKKYNIPASSIKVSLEITVPDGGEDGRIRWDGEIEKTNWITNNNTMYQCKAVKSFGPMACREEVLNEDQTEIKQKIDELLNSKGAYVIMTTARAQDKEKNIKAIREEFKEKKKKYADSCEVLFYDCVEVAAWSNEYPSAIREVFRMVNKGMRYEFQTWSEWNKSEEHKFKYVPYEKFDLNIQQLKDHYQGVNKIARITGLSGLGKTRLAFEAFRPTKNDSYDIEQQMLSDMVLYIDVFDDSELVHEIRGLRSEGKMCTLIIDDCSIELHESLSKEITHSESKLNLLTLDYDTTKSSSEQVVVILGPTPDDVIKAY